MNRGAVMAKSKSRSARKPVRKTAKRATPKKVCDEDAFTQSLVAHGQAVKLPADGKLPPGATHELVEDKDGTVRAVRRRFSAM
jgi:hypothetical protein